MSIFTISYFDEARIEIGNILLLNYRRGLGMVIYYISPKIFYGISVGIFSFRPLYTINSITCFMPK